MVVFLYVQTLIFRNMKICYYFLYIQIFLFRNMKICYFFLKLFFLFRNLKICTSFSTFKLFYLEICTYATFSLLLNFLCRKMYICYFFSTFILFQNYENMRIFTFRHFNCKYEDMLFFLYIQSFLFRICKYAIFSLLLAFYLEIQKCDNFSRYFHILFRNMKICFFFSTFRHFIQKYEYMVLFPTFTFLYLEI